MGTKTVTVTVSELINVTKPSDQYLKSVQRLLGGVIHWVQDFRGLDLKENVSVVVLTKSWVVEHWGKQLLNLTEVKLEEVMLKSLFMVPEEFNLTKFKVEVSGYMVAGSADHTIYVVKDFFNPSDKLGAGSTLAHELTHILQGEYFKLPEPSSTDERNALNALIEGDACFVGSQYLVEHGGKRGQGYMEALVRPIDALWLFPYMYGEQFVKYVYQRYGWGGVNKLYQDPPTSTAQVLHPQKYLQGWRPTRVDPIPPPGDGWTLMFQDVMGEFFVRQVIRSHLDIMTANRSAEGWLGDVLQIYERNGTYMLRWKILWENKAEAEEFLEAFKQVLKKVNAENLNGTLWRADNKKVDVRLVNEATLLTVIYNPLGGSATYQQRIFAWAAT